MKCYTCRDIIEGCSCPDPEDTHHSEVEGLVEWKDGMIVEFMSYAMHHNEGGGEEWESELSVFQRGIVLGNEVVGCDYELSKDDFIDGTYVDGIDAGGGYRADEYIKAVLVEPDWLRTALTTHGAKEYERGKKHGTYHAWMDAIELSNKLEESNTKFDEWRAFKGFRNALHDKIRKLSDPQTDVTKN